jgi:signal transduction histidine kinase
MGLRVLVLSGDSVFAASACGVLSAQLPEASCESLAPERIRACPDASALVLDGRADVAAALERAGLIRAMGFGGALVIVGAADEAAQGLATQFGYAFAAPDALASSLVPRLADAMREATSPLGEPVRRARRLVAAGEVALKLQHSLNNPLAAILAESQLLQLDVKDEEQRAALGRIVTMCRRMVELLRGLDGVGERLSR